MGLKDLIKKLRRRGATVLPPADTPLRSPEPRAPAPRRPLYPVVGIDYGTCFTKVVLQEENVGVIEVVRDPTGEILHPSLIGYEKGILYGPQAVNASNVLPYLKMLAAEKGPAGTGTLVFSDEVQALQERPNWADALHGMLAWYFLHVVDRVRSHLQENRLGSRRFDDSPSGSGDQLSINLGIPEVHAESGTEQIMVSALRTAVSVHARQITTPPSSIPLDEWLEICSGAMSSTSHQDTSDLIQGYPEVAAGIQAVLRSPNAADGIYITVDVGGGTVDMNVFRRSTPAGSRIPMDTSEQLGCYGSDVSPWGAERRSSDTVPFAGIPRLEGIAESTWGFDPVSIQDWSEGYRIQIAQVKAFALIKQPNYGRPPTRRTYDDALVYMWGGGASVSDYRSILVQMLGDLIQNPVIRNLPVPAQLREVAADAEPTRLAVAFGLSHNPMNLSKIRPPDAFTEIPRPKTRRFFPQKPGDPGFWTMNSPD